MSVSVIRATSEVYAEMQRIVEETNKKLVNGEETEAEGIVASCKSKIDELAKEYKQGAEHEYYTKLAKESIANNENAMKKIITNASFNTKILTTVNDEVTKVPMSVSLTDRPVRIDIASFDRVYMKNSANKGSAAVDARWLSACQKLNQLFCLQQAKTIGMEQSIIDKTYYLRDKAREIEIGKNPISNSKLLGAVQDVVNMIIYEKNEETGNNTYKATSHDVGYLKSVYSKISSKNELSVTVMNDRRFLDALVRMMKRVITDGSYGVDGYREIKKD